MNTALYNAVIDAEYSVTDAERRIADITYSLNRASDERTKLRAELDGLHHVDASRKELIAEYKLTLKNSLRSRPWHRRFILTSWERGYLSEIRLFTNMLGSDDAEVERIVGRIATKDRDIKRTQNILAQWQEKLRVSELDAHGYRTGYLEPAFAY